MDIVRPFPAGCFKTFIIQVAQAITQDFQDHTPVLSPDGSRLAVSYWQHNHWKSRP
jgi:hypothetical protein